MKTIPELQEDLKKLEQKITFLGQVISAPHPYNSLDILTINVTRNQIQDYVDQLTIDISNVVAFTRKTIDEETFFDIALHRNALVVYVYLKEITDAVDKLAERTNSYLSLIDSHP